MATLQANPGFSYEEENLKENLGLLRRAFSSIKKRRKKKEVTGRHQDGDSKNVRIDDIKVSTTEFPHK
nr:hypothetical protein BaRGS_016190 [Batillaria attramentaria]